MQCGLGRTDVIYKLGTDWTVPENVVMKGSHKGVLVFANKMPEPVSVKANGKITEAYAPFEMCMGRTAHSWSTVYFTLGPAPIAIGGVRIN